MLMVEQPFKFVRLRVWFKHNVWVGVCVLEASLDNNLSRTFRIELDELAWDAAPHSPT